MSKDNELDIDFLAGFGFDPKWTVKEAIEVLGKDGSPNDPFFRWEDWTLANEEHILFKEGNPEVLLKTMHRCMNRNLPMPRWVVEEFDKGLKEWGSYETSTLDEAFNMKPLSKAELHREKLGPLMAQILILVGKMKEKGTPVDQHLFEEVGKQLTPQFSGSKVRDAYYEWQKRLK